MHSIAVASRRRQLLIVIGSSGRSINPIDAAIKGGML